MGLPKEELQPQKLTFQEYINLERENDQKYEYHDGFVIAMAGGTINHSRISGNIFGKFWSLLNEKGGDCEVLNSDTKLAFQDKKKYLYPDAMVVCGEVEESEHKNHGVTNPIIIIEVLSKSTEELDREDKFSLYKQIPSLEYYVLILQDKPQLEIYRRMKLEKQDANKSLWQIETITGIEKMLSFPTLDIKIPFTDIYRKVEF
ncbi:Uma2 family endonuclease [Bernardetia sp. Wsw4-3y2]|uniref:Uma2 family endonuclease n=1 Tax=Bernardetia sp. Wsw4-3y2 TaxID=3127471 RepID=UPI0030D0F923